MVDLEKIAQDAFIDELQKLAGPITEGMSFGGYLPLDLPALGIGYAMKPKTKEQMKKQEKKTWSNLLLPGVGPYRLGRRLKFNKSKKSKK